jgi:hypothetical protein
MTGKITVRLDAFIRLTLDPPQAAAAAQAMNVIDLEIRRRERTVEQCERFAEDTGFACRVAGHFPDIPFPPPPVFVADPHLAKYQRTPRYVEE